MNPMNDITRRQMTGVTLLFAVGEGQGDDRVPVVTAGSKYAVLESYLSGLHSGGFIKPDSEQEWWGLDDKGIAVIRKMCELLDFGNRFQIFEAVNLQADMSGVQWNDEDDMLVDHGVYDPIFGPYGAVGEPWSDYRLMVVDWLATHAPEGTEGADQIPDDFAERWVFLTKLVKNSFDGATFGSESFWRKLAVGELFGQVEEIITHEWSWKKLADTEEESARQMAYFYARGALEVRKRDGDQCPKCATPLRVYDDFLPDDESVDSCPKCGESFDNYEVTDDDNPFEPEDGRWEPDEEMVTETIVTTETYDDYGYDPIYYAYYYDPFEPYVDGVIVGACAGFALGAFLY